MRPYLEKTFHTKKAGEVAQDVGLEFKPQYQSNNNNNNEETWRRRL
jgi:hypothetical protein